MLIDAGAMKAARDQSRLFEAVSAVCPIVGVSGGREDLRIDFAAVATQSQRDAAQFVIANFDWGAPADAAWKEAKTKDAQALREALAKAIADNAAYVDVFSPNSTQIINQTKQLSRQMTLVLRALDKLL